MSNEFIMSTTFEASMNAPFDAGLLALVTDM